MNEFMKSGTGLEDFKGISDFIDLKMLQNILDNFARATGLSFVTVDHRGNPVTEYSGFTKFCHKIRSYDQYRENCYKCDETGGLRAAVLGKPYFYKCHTGLVDFAIPIMLRGNYLGAILAGQTKVEESYNGKVEYITTKTKGWENNIELKEAYGEIDEVSLDKITSTAYTLHEISKYIVEKEYLNIVKQQLNNRHLKYMEEEKKQTELEKSLKEAELKALQYQINPHFLFNALNTICRLAYIEGATKTEEMGYAFSEMMRYVLKKNTSQLMKLKEEIGHSKNYLKIQKIRLGERLNYSIDIPEKYYDISCPFMMLQPLVENSVKYVAEVRESGGLIHIKGYDDGNDLIITVKDDGDGIPQDKIKDILHNDSLGISSEVSGKEEIGLANVNKRLIHFFGDRYGLEIGGQRKGSTGTVIKIRLPLMIGPSNYS